MKTLASSRRSPSGEAHEHGFSLVELLVAMTVFLVVSAVSFELFGRHQTMLSQEQVTGRRW